MNAKELIIGVTLSALLAVGLTYGADKKGSELPVATSVTSSDKLFILQDGANKTVTYGNVPHNSLGGRTTSDAHSQGAITGLTSALAAKQAVLQNATSLQKIGTGGDGNPTWKGMTWPGGTGSGHSIQDEGLDVTQRDTINFTGAGVTVTDVAGKTTVTIPSGGGVSSFNSRTGTVTPQSSDYASHYPSKAVMDAYTSTGGGRPTADEVAATYAKKIYLDVRDYGAVADVVSSIDGVATASDATFTSASVTFTADDVGKTIVISNVAANYLNLYTTIASINNAHSIELTDAPTYSSLSTNVEFAFGTDDSAALQAAVDTASARSYINEIIGPDYRITIVGPQDRMLIASPIVVSYKDDVEFRDMSIVIGGDINAFEVSHSRWTIWNNVHVDGMTYNQVNNTQTNLNAILFKVVDTGYEWWEKLRSPTVQDCTFERVKGAIASDGQHAGVGLRVTGRNLFKSFHVKDSVGIDTPLTDSQVEMAMVTDFRTNIKVRSYGDASTFKQNHPFVSGEYGNIYLTGGATVNGSPTINFTGLSAAQQARLPSLIGHWLRISAGFASTTTHYRVISATGTSLTFATNAISNQSGVVVQSYSTAYNFDIDSTQVIDLLDNWIDIAQIANIKIRNSEAIRIAGGFIMKNFFPASIGIDLGNASFGAINDIKIKDVYFRNTLSGDTNATAITLTNVNTNTSTGVQIGELLYSGTDHWTPYAWPKGMVFTDTINAPYFSDGTTTKTITELAAASGSLPSGVTAPGSTHVYEIDTDASSLLGMKIHGDGDRQKFDMYTYGTGSANNAFRYYKANGTEASPTSLSATDIIGGFTGFCYHSDGTPGFSGAASIRFTGAENCTATANGTDINFHVTPKGGTFPTNPTTQLNSEGSLAIKNAAGTPAAITDFAQLYSGDTNGAGTSGFRMLTEDNKLISFGTFAAGTGINLPASGKVLVNGSEYSPTLAVTATALAANGTNCSVGQAARGVDASGNAENCFAPTAAAAGSYSAGPPALGDMQANQSSALAAAACKNDFTNNHMLCGGTGVSGQTTGIGYFVDTDTSANTPRGVISARYADAGAPNMYFMKSRGSESSPTAVTAGNLGIFGQRSFTGTQWLNAASFGFATDGTIDDNTIPTKFVVLTGGNSQTARFEVASDGRIRLIGQPSAPANNSACAAGDMILDAANAFLYLCTSTNAWKRASFAAY